MNLNGLNIYPVLGKKTRCCVCNANHVPCYHRDFDFGNYYICQECSGFVILAEAFLLELGFSQPPAGGMPAATERKQK
jgi:hypothetical protein